MTRIRQYVGSNAVGFLALIIALGGTSYAAVQLPKNSVGAPQIKKDAVRSADVKNSTVKLKDLSKEVTSKLGAGSTGPAGPTGPAGGIGATGPIGPQGPAGPSTIISAQDGGNFFPQDEFEDVGDPIIVAPGSWWVRLSAEVVNNDATDATQADCQITRSSNLVLHEASLSVTARAGKVDYDRGILVIEGPLVQATNGQIKARCRFDDAAVTSWIGRIRLTAFSATSLQTS